MNESNDTTRIVRIEPQELEGFLSIPEGAQGLVIFAHGSGSSRFSPRNAYVAERLRDHRMGTLLFDLLTPEEASDRANVFDIPLLGRRVAGAVRWAREKEETRHLPVGLFGASTGAAAALVGAAEMPDGVAAVVSRGGRPDLAGDALAGVRAPVLLIVGGQDYGVIELNEQAFHAMTCEKELEIIPGATHLFEERGALGKVVEKTARWFETHLGGRAV
ncbi:MAG: dienelactone hydrolase family protein [Alphaproteobacteria bacterium]